MRQKPLQFLLTINPSLSPSRQAEIIVRLANRYLDYIAQFNIDVHHISGKDNVGADAFPRIESIVTTINYQALQKEQETDSQLREFIEHGSALKLQKIVAYDAEVYCDLSTAIPRPYLTPSFRRQAFDSLHNLSHPGPSACAKLISQKFMRPGVQRDCRTWSKIVYNAATVSRHTHAPLAEFATPSDRFLHVHLDIVGPLPCSCDNKYCLTAIDRYRRWPEAYPLSDVSAETCAKAFLTGCIARFGCPSTITTDRGGQFES